MRTFGISRGLLLVLFLAVGAVFGGVLGELIASTNLAGTLPLLTKTYTVFDIQNVRINLYVISFAFSITFAPNLIALLGLICAGYLFRRL